MWVPIAEQNKKSKKCPYCRQLKKAWSIGSMDGWMNQAYSRLSNTHSHITDCKLVCMYWTRLVLVRPAASLASPLKHHPTGKQWCPNPDHYSDSKLARRSLTLLCWALSRAAEPQILTSFVWRGWGSNHQPPACQANAQPLHYPAAVQLHWSLCMLLCSKNLWILLVVHCTNIPCHGLTVAMRLSIVILLSADILWRMQMYQVHITTKIFFYYNRLGNTRYVVTCKRTGTASLVPWILQSTYVHITRLLFQLVTKPWDGWMNQAYSRLSTTHGHITDCKLVCMSQSHGYITWRQKR